jgi:hypothetical protein
MVPPPTTAAFDTNIWDQPSGVEVGPDYMEKKTAPAVAS